MSAGIHDHLTPLQQWRISRDREALLHKIDADRRAAAEQCVALWQAREQAAAQDAAAGRVSVRYAAAGGGTHQRPAQVLARLPGDRVRVRLLDSGSLATVSADSIDADPRDDFEPRTLPAVYASELPECRGNCDQGRRACSHPAVCATAPDRSTDDDDEDDLPGPVTQALTLEIIDRELAAERRTLSRLIVRALGILGVMLAGASLLGCGGGDPIIAQATNQPGAFVTPVWPGVGEVVAARLEITCPAACVIDVDQQSSWVWTAEAPDTSLSATVDVVKVGDKRLAPGTRMDLMSSGGPGPWSAAVGLQRQFRGEAGEPVVIELRVSLDQPTRRLAITNARLTAEGRAL